MRITIVGAGGLGSYVGAVLGRAGNEVSLVARGAHGEAIERDGLYVHEPEDDFVTHPRCLDSTADVGQVDVVFVAVKSFSLDEVAGQLASLAEKGAIIVPLLNGVDATDRLRLLGIPSGNLVDGVAYLTAFRTAPGRIERKGQHQRLVIGSVDGASSGHLERVAAAFADTRVDVELSADIEVALWGKMAVVCSITVMCAFAGGSIGPIRAHPFGRDQQERAIAEVFAVARARGVDVPDDAHSEVGGILDAFPDDFYPSVLHDLSSGRRTEMDALGGYVSRLGRQLGVSTPLSDTATCVVQIREALAAANA